MKANKSISFDMDVLVKIQEVAEDNGKTVSEAVNLLVRHGYIRMKEMEKARTVLYPIDAEKLR